jgi:phage baseplate assembly protein W
LGDISHVFGNDIDLSASGDFLYVTDETQQHVIKRLLTALGADIWDTSYGAGLGLVVGQPVDVNAIKNIIFSQIFNEASVAKFPTPDISVNQENSTVSVTISYSDSSTQQTRVVSFTLGS